MNTVHGRGARLLFFLRFSNGPILVQINLQLSQAQPYGIYTLFIEQHIEKQLVPFLSLCYDSVSGGLEP